MTHLPLIHFESLRKVAKVIDTCTTLNHFISIYKMINHAKNNNILTYDQMLECFENKLISSNYAGLGITFFHSFTHTPIICYKWNPMRSVKLLVDFYSDKIQQELKGTIIHSLIKTQ